MDEQSLIDYLTSRFLEGWQWIDENVLTYETLGQLGVAALLVATAFVFSNRFKKATLSLAEQFPVLERAETYMRPLYLPLLALILLLVATILGRALGFPVYVFGIASSLLTAWIVIRLAANLIRNRPVARVVASIVWAIAALEIFTLLDPVIAVLQSAAIQVGDGEVSAYDFIWGVASFVFLIWLAILASGLLDSRLKKSKAITPSAQVLIGKVIKISLVTIAFVIALNSTGIDLTALAVFGGALGVGLGFGLQKVVSNFISGMILLLDRSIKPGDVIEIGDTYGSINALAARYTSVITRDGTEFLIPNEDMITQQVINWTHSHSNIRRRIGISVSYNTDLDLAMEIMKEAANNHTRVLKYPEPKSLLKGFGDNGVDLELRMWISDPQNDVSNVSSDVMLEIWNRFHEEGIEFPFPQRVIHYADEPKRRAERRKVRPDQDSSD